MRVGILVVAASALAAVATPAARAHGDPVTVRLQIAPLYAPPHAKVPSELLRRLAAEVNRARDAGFPVKVALVAAPSDLGPRLGFFGRPALLASYVARDLEAYFSGSILVVMHAGFGLVPADRADRIAGVRIGPGDAGLARAAVRAVHLLAGGGPEPAGSRPQSEWRDRLTILGAVVIALLFVLGVRVGRGRRQRGASPA